VALQQQHGSAQESHPQDARTGCRDNKETQFPRMPASMDIVVELPLAAFCESFRVFGWMPRLQKSRFRCPNEVKARLIQGLPLDVRVLPATPPRALAEGAERAAAYRICTNFLRLAKLWYYGAG